MIRKNKPQEKKEFEEQLVQKFPHGCPYCEQPVSYDQLELKPGENEIRCPSCKKIYIRVIPDPARNDLVRKIPPFGRKGEGGSRVF
jgi:hypothetical protein